MVMEKTEFNYFYGNEADLYSFYRIPKELFTNEKFKNLSTDAKLIYGLMLDRMSLSLKNGWLDEQKRVYIFFSMEEVMESMNCSKNKALKSLGELDTETGIGLIERVKQGQGKPTIIYVKNFNITEKSGSDFPKKEVLSPKKGKSRSSKKGSLEVEKKDPNNTNINNTELSNTESNLILSADTIGLDMKTCMNTIRDNLEIDTLCERYPFDRELLEGIYEMVVETVLSKGDTIVIASNPYPTELVRGKFMKLHSGHVEYVMDSMKGSTSKVRNIKKYMLAALFNAPTTMSTYYKIQVNHDYPQYAVK